MDSNLILDSIRTLVEEHHETGLDPEQVDRLVDLFDQLDEHLVKGGNYPRSWEF